MSIIIDHVPIVPAISKILENILNNRIIQDLDKFKIISDPQFGFRRGKSTEDTISKLTSLNTQHLDSGKKCIAVFLDLKKAYDAVSVPIFVNKLEHIGIKS